MAQEARGVVSRISEKPYEGQILYSFQLSNDSSWYSLGSRAPNFSKGQSIQFEVDTRGTRNYAKNVSPWEGSGESEAPAVRQVANRGGNTRTPWAGKGGKAPEEKAYWESRQAKEEVTQRRIEIQAARNAAIETTKILLDNGLIKIVEKDKYSQGYSIVNGLIEELMGKYLGDNDSLLNNTTNKKETNTNDTARDGNNRPNHAIEDKSGTDWDD